MALPINKINKSNKLDHMKKKQRVEFRGFKIESQLELSLMRKAPAVIQICCILIKNSLRKTQRVQLNEKTNALDLCLN